MKKFFSFFTAASLFFALSACSLDIGTKSKTDDSSTTKKDTTTEKKDVEKDEAKDEVKDEETPVTKEDGRYYNETKGFSLVFPEDWASEEGFMGTDVSVTSPMESDTDMFAENMNVVSEEGTEGISLQEYYDLNIANMEPLVADFTVVDLSDITINGLDSKRLEYSATFGEVQVHNYAWFFVVGNMGYVITATANNETFATYKNQFNTIANSFKLE